MSTPDDPPTKVSVGELAPEHLEALNQALFHVLSTTVAERTLAQIVDGLPTSDMYGGYLAVPPEEIWHNAEPSSASTEAVKAFRKSFRPATFQLDAQIAQAYQDSPLGSKNFTLRLLEMVAIACHSIAAFLFTNAERVNDEHARDGQPTSHASTPGNTSLQSRLTDFVHPDYDASEQYPHGVADVVGYWAEYELFGGVVLFDRGLSGAECIDAFIHPVGGFKIFQLSEDQICQIASWTWADRTSAVSADVWPSLPFRAEKYARRIDPYVAMSLHIYRDLYERRLHPVKPIRCVQRLEDFPEMVDFLELLDHQ